MTSTWGGDSLFGSHFELIPRLLTELPATRYQVAAPCHPSVWFGHGRSR